MTLIFTPSDPEGAERELRRQLAELHREYSQRAKPLIDALVNLEMLKPTVPFVVDCDKWPPEALAKFRSSLNLPQE